MLWWHIGGAWWSWLIVAIMAVCMCGFLIAAIAAVVAPSETSEPGRRRANGSAGEILTRRLARGDITREEYLIRLELLGLESPPDTSHSGGGGHGAGSALGN